MASLQELASMIEAISKFDLPKGLVINSGLID